MRVALTGASGFIGSFIARHLASAGHEVSALVRDTSRRDHIEKVVDRFVVGDQADDSAWAELFEDAACVVHNSVDWSSLRSPDADLDKHLRSNLASSIRMLRAAAPRQFIFMSTIAVHHDMRPRWQGVIDEDHPLRPSSAYGAYKAAVEAHLWVAHFNSDQNTCAMRPCAVYGMDPDLERSYGLGILRRVKEGRQPLSRPGGGKFVHVDDVAAAAVAAVGNNEVAGQPFNLVDCYARWGDWAKIACDILGRSDLEVDLSSPAEPQNRFRKDEVRENLLVPLDRGFQGIRQHLEALVAHGI